VIDGWPLTDKNAWCAEHLEWPKWSALTMTSAGEDLIPVLQLHMVDGCEETIEVSAYWVAEGCLCAITFEPADENGRVAERPDPVYWPLAGVRSFTLERRRGPKTDERPS